MTEYLDPTDSVAVPRKTATRPPSLDGKVITLLDISKAQGNHLLDRLEELLRERATPKAIIRKKKPTFARPAPDALRKEIVGATDVIVEGLADERNQRGLDARVIVLLVSSVVRFGDFVVVYASSHGVPGVQKQQTTFRARDVTPRSCA